MRKLRLGISIVIAGMFAVILAAIGQDKMPKDNSACLVCHINLQNEEIASTHLKKGLTCAHCHGVSYEHMNDEEAAAEPDILFGRAEVEPSCRKCHQAHKNPDAVAKFLAEWKGKRRPQGRLILSNAICTDCHGLHRLPRGGGTSSK
jgi:hypothetical protein